MDLPTNIPQARLRRFLQAILVTDSDLDAFCLDYFPDVHSRFSSAMDRTQKLNLLIVRTEQAVLLSALHETEPKRCDRYHGLLESDGAGEKDSAMGTFAQPKPPTMQRAHDRDALLDILCGMSNSMFETVVFRLNLRSALLLPRTAAQTERAIQIIEMLEFEGSAGLPRLTAAIAKTAPELLK